MVPNGLTKRFAFLSPHCTGSPQGASQYIASILKASKNDEGKWLLAPYNVGFHWVLIVIDATAKTIYYLDPLHGGRPEKYKKQMEVFNKAIISYRGTNGDTYTKRQLNTLFTWSTIQVPKQTNGIDYGYYVMRFMKEIVQFHSNESKIPPKYFPDCNHKSYSREMLDEVKEELASYLLEEL